MDVITYQCPNCGAPLTFHSDTGKWDCEFCNSSFTKEMIDEADQKREPAFQPEPEPEESDAAGLRRYTCPQCGAEIITDATTAATFCVFCQNPAIMVSQLSGDFRPQKIIPFRNTREEAVAAFRRHCRRKPLLPRDFVAAGVEKLTGIYIPFWLYDCQLDGRMAAMAQRVTTWRQGSYQYTKTDHYRLSRAARMNFVRVPADGSSKMGDELMDAIEPYDYSGLENFAMSYLSGFLAERYDVDSNQCFPRVEDRVKTSCRELLRNSMDGYTGVQVVHEDIRLGEHRCAYALLPVWLLISRYQGKEYLFAMNGQTGKIVGTLPISRGRLFAWLGGLLAGLTVLLLLGGMLF